MKALRGTQNIERSHFENAALAHAGNDCGDVDDALSCLTIEAVDALGNDEVSRHKLAMHKLRKMRREARLRAEVAAYTLFQAGPQPDPARP